MCRAELNTDKPEAAIDLPKIDLMHGVIQFQLLNKNGNVLSEELAFIDTSNLNDNVTVTPSKKVYNSNEQVELDIDFKTLAEKDAKANMSVSVTQVNPTVDNHVTNLDITSHLLLNSEIKDNMQQFGVYLDNDALRKKTIQQVLIAQNNNQHLFNEDAKTRALKFSPEAGFKLSGVVKRKNKKKQIKAHVALSYKNGKEIGHDQTTTDSLGRFSFNNLNFDDRTFIALKAKSLNAKKYGNSFTIELDSTSQAQFKSKKLSADGNAETSVKHNRNTEFAAQEGEIKLGQVNINAEKKRLDRFAKKRKATLYPSVAHTLDFKRLRESPSASNILQAIQGLFPGVHVLGVSRMGELGGGSVTIRGRNSLTGNNEPLFLLDGFPTDLDMIQSVPIQEVDFIDIVKGASTSIYGVRGEGGVIAVYTLDGTEEESNVQYDKNGTVSFYHPGYYQAKTFNPNANNSSTLYWNPDLKVNPSENNKITFNANKSGTYKVLLEGITSDGTPLKSEAYFEVN